MKKLYVLDTNILLTYPSAIEGFEDNDVCIAMTTLGELDNKKTAPGEVGYNARETIRFLDSLRVQNSLCGGILLRNGGTFHIVPENYIKSTKPDDRIIEVARGLMSSSSDTNVILVTNDIAMRVKASIMLGADHVQEYKNTAVKNTYTGHRDMEVPAEMIDEIYINKRVNNVGLTVSDQPALCENEFITLHAGTSSALSVYRNGDLILIPEEIKLYDGVKPKNAMQRYAAWALTQPADELPLVILSGCAGTAKTFLSLAVGLDKTISDQKYWKNEYNKMLISRPNTEAGDAGFGYLPGTLEDKMEPLLLPYYDNLESLLMSEEEDRTMIRSQIDDLFENGIIEVCALSYIRGRTLPNSYIICDEAQNSQRQLLKDVITRAGEGSKVVIAGDPTQCDNPQLDAYNNGLVYAIDSWRDSKYAAIVTLEDKHSVRSALAREALARMK